MTCRRTLLNLKPQLLKATTLSTEPHALPLFYLPKVVQSVVNCNEATYRQVGWQVGRQVGRQVQIHQIAHRYIITTIGSKFCLPFAFASLLILHYLSPASETKMWPRMPRLAKTCQHLLTDSKTVALARLGLEYSKIWDWPIPSQRSMSQYIKNPFAFTRSQCHKEISSQRNYSVAKISHEKCNIQSEGFIYFSVRL